MTKERERLVIMAGQIRHDAADRWRRAYQLLWRGTTETEAAIAEQEVHDASSSLVCASINSATGTGSDH